ncbi:MAG: type II toxin-antitoxin system HipA family toxin, partial [Gammaproteobacteria bacterium]|nr:type II toxin-antitoxin system HipA family toxin [Gammaproteobacteria bacterium]
DVMSAAPYPELSAHKVKLAMSVGDKRHYRLKEILPRHFYQTGQKAGLREQNMDEILPDLVAQIDDAITAVASLAEGSRVPLATYEPILAGVEKRAKLIHVEK